MKDKVEFIRQESSDKKCYICNGTGVGFEGGMCGGEVQEPEPCDVCRGTGVFKDNHYIMIANGMAFGVDTIK